VRFTLDSNILVYAMGDIASPKHTHARDILIQAVASDAFLTNQAIGEFLNVIRRKSPALFPEAIEQARSLIQLFQVMETAPEQILAGAELSARHKLQFWDSVLWSVAQAAGAKILVSEDLQDGFSLDGMTVLDPFAPINATRLASLLAGMAEPS
jgi:predicted nucleic acid-binding protein